MKISLIVAKSKNGVIGLNDTIPWRLSSDLKNFKKITMGHHIVMGSKTFNSLPKKLKGRTILVMSRKIEGESYFNSVEEILNYGKKEGLKEIIIAGGEMVYRSWLKYVDTLYISEVNCDIEGDRFFPNIDINLWYIIKKKFYPITVKDQYSWVFKIYKRR